MRKVHIAALLLACALPVCAQSSASQAQPEDGTAPTAAAAHKKSEKKRAKTQAQQAVVSTDTAKADPARQSDQDADESVVMIDSKPDPDDAGRFSASQSGEQDEAAVPGGIPSSYGQCKGVATEEGRTMLVFESADDGTITFVQVTAGKNRVSWRLVDRIPRSAD